MINFRRKPPEDAPATADEATPDESDQPVSVAGTRTRSYTPGKGKATPKRRDQGKRLAEKPPANRREAMRRMRDKQREARQKQRLGMMAGQDEYLPNRDRGPERALIRDVVDSRRSLATYFILGLFIVIIGSSQAMPVQVRVGTNIFWILLAVAVIVDCVLLARKIKRMVRERFPDSKLRPGGNQAYGIMRAFSMRRLRIPAPRVKPGATV